MYLFLPGAIAALSSSEPSHASEVFSWVKPLTKQALEDYQNNSDDLDSAVRFLGPCAGMFALYAFLLRLVKGRQPFALQALIYSAGALFLLSSLFSKVMLSTDIFSYAMYGRIFAAYHSSPYLPKPPFGRSEPFFALLHHHYIFSVYGPFWTLLSAGIMRFAGARVGLTVLLFRLLSCGSVLAGAAFILGILRRHAPERATQGLVLFLWNPLVLIESGLSGHNDATMVALLLLGIWLHTRGHKVGAAAAITLSGLVKFVTGALVPLYVWMVLREAATWRERALYLLQTMVVTAVLVLTTVVVGRANTALPAAHFAASAQFYSNNFHELLLSGIRRLLGEDPATAQVPVNFGTYWVNVKQAETLRAQPSREAASLGPLAVDHRLVVIAPHLKGDWLRVLDPGTRLKGYVFYPSVEEIEDPANMEGDPALEGLEDTLLDWRMVQRASNIIHVATWGLFAAFGLLAAWRTDSFERFLFWSAAVMLASYYLIMTQFWPWYIPWAVALGALKPGAAPAKLAAFLSATVLTLYISLGFEDSNHEWIYAYRSLPTLVVPLVAFALLYGLRLRGGRLRQRAQGGGLLAEGSL